MSGSVRREVRCYSHDLLQALFVHRHLDGNVRKVAIDDHVRYRLHRGVVLRVLVILGDWAYAKVQLVL